MQVFALLKRYWWGILFLAGLLALVLFTWEAQQKVNRLEQKIKDPSPENQKTTLLHMKIFLLLLAALLPAPLLNAQTLNIHPGTSLVMKGNVQLVLRDVSIVNNGVLHAGTGTVKFTGYKDSSASFFAGNPTTLYNLSIDKTAYGTALTTPVSVRNVLGVYGGQLFTDSNLVLKSAADLTARVDVIPAAAGIIGKSIVERYFPNRRSWRLVTAPVTAAPTIFDSWQNKAVYLPGINTCITGPNPSGPAGNGLDASPQNNASMKTWNYATQLLEPVLNTKTPLSAGNNGSADNTGYFLFVRGDRDINNFIIPNSNNTTLICNGKLQTGTQSFTAATIPGAVTLIGNPFASPVDFNAVAGNNLVKRFYVWDPTLNIVGGYVMLDDLDNDGLFTKSIAASQQDNHLQSGQAFFVQTLNNGPASVVFPETCKSAAGSNALFRPSSPAAMQTIRIALNRMAADSSMYFTDAALLECSDAFSDSVDLDDAVKFSNINENIGLQRYGQVLTAERRPILKNNDTIFLKINRTTPGNYQFVISTAAINDVSLQAWLEDGYLQSRQEIDLSSTGVIDFTIDGNAASAAPARFRIVFRRLQVLPVTFISVTARDHKDRVDIEWRVANEWSLTHYEIEHSVDANNFIRIGTQAVAGNDGAVHLYQFVDPARLPGNNFYRIKAYDAGGNITSSTIVNVFINDKNKRLSIYPNPVQNNFIHVYLGDHAPGTCQVRLYNSSAQLLHAGTIGTGTPGTAITLKPENILPAGIYQLEIIYTDNKKEIRQFIVAN